MAAQESKAKWAGVLWASANKDSSNNGPQHIDKGEFV
jgi:hypothetical protein